MCVATFGHPQLQISAIGILFGEMLNKTAPLPFLVEFTVVLQAILYGAAERNFRVDNAVGLGNDASVDASWCVARRGSMVLDSLRHHLNLLRRKPSPQLGLSTHNGARDFVVAVAAGNEAGIVIGSNGIGHVDVDFGVPGSQIQALGNHRSHMVDAMCGIEAVVARQDGALNIFTQPSIDFPDVFFHRSQ